MLINAWHSRPRRETRRSPKTHECNLQSDIDVETIKEHFEEDRDHVSDQEDNDRDDDIAESSAPLSSRDRRRSTLSERMPDYDDRSEYADRDSEPKINTSLDEIEWHPRGRSRVDAAELSKELIRRFSQYPVMNSFTTDTDSCALLNEGRAGGALASSTMKWPGKAWLWHMAVNGLCCADWPLSTVPWLGQFGKTERGASKGIAALSVKEIEQLARALSRKDKSIRFERSPVSFKGTLYHIVQGLQVQQLNDVYMMQILYLGRPRSSKDVSTTRENLTMHYS